MNQLTHKEELNRSSKPDKQLADLAHKATQKRREDASADIGQIDREINRLVYELYDLTKEEIEIVERTGEK